jgi:hypothetical protein
LTVTEILSGALPIPNEMSSPPRDVLHEAPRESGIGDRVPLGEFRRRVETIQSRPESYVVKYLYLMGARANEACSLSVKSDVANGNTAALGPRKKDVEWDVFEGHEVLRITFHTLKRKNRDSRVVALPLGGFDPWTDELSKMFEKLGPDDGLIPFNRRQTTRILNRNGFVIPRKKASMKNPLRHVRINHLISYYGFTPFQVTAYIGWDPATALLAMGGASTLSEYQSIMWPDYFPKLLKPVPVAGQI